MTYETFNNPPPHEYDPPPFETDGRNAVFTSLVRGDSDITGLVAYSVFKQNELDWLNHFRKIKGREPTEAETEAYVIGESTARRLATYRHLADATLSGKGPDVAGSGANAGRTFPLHPKRAAPLRRGSALAYLVIGLVVLIGVYLAIHFGARA